MFLVLRVKVLFFSLRSFVAVAIARYALRSIQHIHQMPVLFVLRSDTRVCCGCSVRSVRWNKVTVKYLKNIFSVLPIFGLFGAIQTITTVSK